MKEKQKGKKKNIGSVSLIGLLGVGDTVYFCNRWKNFRFPEMNGCFERMTEKDIERLRTGNIIWKDEEPYSIHGKVYGYTCEQVEKIEKQLEGGRVTYGVYFSTGGFTLFPNSRRLYKLTDPDRLIALLQQEKYAPALEQDTLL